MLRRALSISRKILIPKTACRLSYSRITIGNRRMADSGIVKSLNDKREYRLISLDNGLRALLISDLDGHDQAEFMEEGVMSQSESESEEDMDESSGSGSDFEDVDDDQQSGEKKSAAALCVGVGSFSDPEDIPGFAHFLEHMVFMGSEKYPDENCFDDYISRHGGESNAWTDHERTCFYFDVERNYFQKSLDKFAQFFVAPLLKQDSVDREIEAVDSEFQESTTSDTDRLLHIMTATAKPGNPMGKFLIGNADTLKRIPEKRGENIYGRLRDFYNRMYSAQYMTLAIQSKHKLDTIEQMVRESFSSVPNNNLDKESFSSHTEPFSTKAFTSFYRVVPVEDVHKLSITWAFPPLHSHYRVKPLDYMSTLLTYDGRGGIFSYLKKNTWALDVTGGNSGEGFDYNSTWSGFDISITLTDDGLVHVDDVIVAVFEYIHMLQQAGPSKDFYEEMKMIEETSFRWKEQGDPTDYVQKVSDNMQQFPVADILTGHKLWYTFDEQLLEQCLSHLRADNCNITVLSNTFADQDICDQTEQWYGTKHQVTDIKPELMERLKDIRRNEAFFMPERNRFIATDFTLKDVKEGEMSFVPKVIQETEKYKLFYKKDNKFNVPKGVVNIHLNSPVVCDSLKSSTLFDLFLDVLQQNLNEDCYPPVLAGYDFYVTTDDTQTGAVILVDGFSHKLHDVLEEVMSQCCNFACDEKLFLAVRTQQKKNYYNEIIKPYEAARIVRYGLIQKTYWSPIDKYRIVDSLTREELSQFVQQFLSQVSVNTMVMGNFTQQEAIGMSDSVMSRLTGEHVHPDKLQQNHVYQLPEQNTYCQIKCFNPTDVNSCLLNYYQSEPGCLRTSCLTQLLQARLREPCFNTLRTKQQLGYSVYSLDYQTHGVLGLGIVIECQADKHSIGHVDKQVEKFLLEMKDVLKKMKKAEFEDLVESVMTLKKVEDTHLREEASRHWSEILEQTYLFDRRQREIHILKTLQLKDLRQWFTRICGPKKRKLSVQLVGTKSGTAEKTIEKPHGSNSSDRPISELQCITDPEQAKSTVIKEIETFKESLKPLPYTKIIS